MNGRVDLLEIWQIGRDMCAKHEKSSIVVFIKMNIYVSRLYSFIIIFVVIGGCPLSPSTLVGCHEVRGLLDLSGAMDNRTIALNIEMRTIKTENFCHSLSLGLGRTIRSSVTCYRSLVIHFSKESEGKR